MTTRPARWRPGYRWPTTTWKDAFRVELPGRSYNLTIGEVLDTIFPEDEAEQDRVIELADLAANPDYPEIYEGMLEVVDQWREGRCLFALFANHGPQVEPSPSGVPAPERVPFRRR